MRRLAGPHMCGPGPGRMRPGLPRGGRAQCPDQGHPRRAGRHPREDLDRAGRLQVRVFDGRRSRRYRARARGARFGVAGCPRPHWLPAVRVGALRREVAALARIGEQAGGFSTYDLGGGLGVAYTEAQHPPEIEAWVGALVDTAHHAGIDPSTRILVQPGLRAHGQCRRHLLHGGVRQAQRLHLGGLFMGERPSKSS